METTKPRILCVDDEPHVLEGLSRHLRRHYDVSTASGGEAALRMIRGEAPFAVVVSDMRMPGMDGAAFLGRVREVAAETTRVLLTGQADLDAAIAAVNQANIFRFLTKPCPPDVLGTALQAAAEQHRIVTAERVLLEQTLRGSVAALTEILALANPAAFGRATRARQYVSQLAAHLDLPDRWQLEVAAMLSHIGCITLPPDTAEKLYHGRTLSGEERMMTERLPTLAAQLLASIPRLEAVRDIILQHRLNVDSVDVPERLPIGARLLKVVLDFDELQAQGVAAGLALNTLRGRAGWYDPKILEALGALLGETARAEIREMRLRDVRPGMTFVEDVVTRTGMLLIPRGQQVTPGLLERIRNFSEHLGVREPVRMTFGNSQAMETTDDRARAAGR